MDEKTRIRLGNIIILLIGGILLFLAIDSHGQGLVYKQEYIKANKNADVIQSGPAAGHLIAKPGLPTEGFTIDVNGGTVNLSGIYWSNFHAELLGYKDVWYGSTQPSNPYKKIYVAWKAKGKEKWLAYFYYGSDMWIKLYYR